MKKETLTARQILICALIVLMALLHAATGQGQTIVKDSTGNFRLLEQRSAKEVSKDTGKTLTLPDGSKLPIFVSERGKFYVLRTSKKTGRNYKQYLNL